MSSAQRGTGLTGTISLEGVGVVWAGKFYKWQPRVEGTPRPRRGRGGGIFRTVRWLFASGTFVFSGQLPIQQKNAPAPDTWGQYQATVTVPLYQGKSVDVPCVVTVHGFEFDEKKNDFPVLMGSAVITGPLVYHGFTSVSGTPPTKTDQQQWEGTTFTYDSAPVALGHASQVTIDWWGTVTDSDAGDVGKLQAVIAAAVPPISGLKLRPSIQTRDAPDGGIITLTYGLTDTNDDQTMPRTVENLDPNAMQTGGTVAAINATPTIPTIAGQTAVERKTAIQKLNDGATVNTTEYGQRDTIDDVQMDESQEKYSEDGLGSEGQKTVVFDFGGPVPADATPADTSKLQAIATLIQELNRDKKKKATYFGVNLPTEQWIYDRQKQSTDPLGLKSLYIIGAITQRGFVPGEPVVSGLVTHHYEDFDVSSPTTSNLYGRLWYLGETTTADDEIFDRTKLDTDPYDLTSAAITGAIVTTGASLGTPTAPATPPNLVLAHWSDQPLTDTAASNKSVRLYFWELRTSQDAIEEDGTHARIDDDGLESEGQATEVYTTTNGPPSDAVSPDGSKLKIVAHLDQILNRVKSKHVTYFDVNSPADKWVFARTRTLSDPSAIKNLMIKGAVYPAGSEPATPAGGAPAGLVLNHTEYFDLTSSDTSDLQGKLWFYGETTSADDVIFERAKSETDPQDIKSSKVTGTIFTTGSPPSDPSAPSGLKIVSYIDTPLTDASASNQSLRLYVWGKLDSKDEIEKLQSKSIADPGSVIKSEIVVKVLATATPVTDNTYNPDTTNLEFYTDEVHAITAAGTVQYVHVITYKPLSPLNEDQEGFKQIVDDPVSDLIADDQRQIDDASATTAAPAITNVAGDAMYCVRRLTKKIGHTLYRHRFWYDFRSNAAKRVAEKTMTLVDLGTHPLESEAFTAEVYAVAGSPVGAGSAPFANAVNINRRDIEIENPSYRLRLYGWAYATAQQKREAEKWQSSDDANNIDDKAIRTKMYDAGDAPDADPDDPPTGNVKKVATLDTKDPLNPNKRMRVWLYGPQDSADQAKLGSVWPRHRYGDDTDASRLESTAERAWLDGDSAITTVTDDNGDTLVLVKTLKHPMSLGLGTDRTLYVGFYGLLTNQQRIEFGESFAEVGNTEVVSSVTASVIDTASSLATLANTEISTQAAAKLWQHTRFIQRVPGKVLKIVKTAADDYEVVENTFTNYNYLPFVGPNVYVTEARQVGSGQWDCYVDRAQMIQTKGNVRLRRYYSNQFGSISNQAILGYANNATFLGFPPGWLIFDGRERRENVGRSGNRQIIIDWKFKVDGLMHYSGAVKLGWVRVASGSAPLGFQSASLFGWLVTPPITTDFAAAFL